MFAPGDHRDGDTAVEEPSCGALGRAVARDRDTGQHLCFELVRRDQ